MRWSWRHSGSGRRVGAVGRRAALSCAACVLLALCLQGCATSGYGGQPEVSGAAEPGLMENIVEASGAQLHIPLPEALTEAQEALLLSAFDERPPFPRVHYNGCHARAEVLARLGWSAVGDGVFKVWLLSSARVTPMSEGAIRFADARWDYHVAVAWVGPAGGVRVLDDLVASEPIALETWLAAFEVDGFAMLLRTHASVYGLFLGPLVGLRQSTGDRVPRNLFNGEAWAYDGCTSMFHEGALEMALNAASEALLEAPERCLAWQPLVRSSSALRGVLTEAVAEGECTGFSLQPRDVHEIPQDCLEVYHAAIETWRRWITWGL